jgi:predicted aldo/keto reductase-like oxidoreductase
MLADNIKRAENFIPMTIEEEAKLFLSAPELSDYVCRQCGSCSCPNGIDIMEIFASEGYFDRQMARGIISDTAEYALMERLRFWYGDSELGIKRYKKLEVGIDACTNCGTCLSLCPYKIDIPKKLVMADYKLGDRDMY